MAGGFAHLAQVILRRVEHQKPVYDPRKINFAQCGNLVHY